jgi:putative ABC transport system permease protein
VRELLYAVRRLRGSPTFTIAATAILAVAIGATASVFGIVDAVLLKPFPFRDPGRVLEIMESNTRLGLPWFAVVPAKYPDWRAQTHAFSSLAATSAAFATVTGLEEPERVASLAVTPSYFSALGVTPALGRALAADSGGPAEVVISYSYWQRRFGGVPSALGRVLTIDDRPYTIVGVAPNGWPDDVQLWTRLSLTRDDVSNRNDHELVVYGRLGPGVSVEAARRELNTIAARLATAYPATDKGWSIATKPLLEEWLGDVRPALVAVLGAAACVLLIGAATLANLFLVRCLAREREMALRSALGAVRGRLVRELLIEAMALGLTAGALGIGVAVAGVRILHALAPSWLPRLSQVTVDARVVGFGALASIATVLVFGLLPAWQTSRGNLADFLKEGGRSSGSAHHHRLQDGLVVLQLTVALVLLTGAGLLVDSFVRLERMDLGFRPQGVLTAGIAVSPQRYPTPQREAAFAARVTERLVAQPGVAAASASTGWPGQGTGMFSFQVVGDSPPDSRRAPVAVATFVTSDYFRTMGIAVQRGRSILPSDDSGAVHVVVIDEILSRRFFVGRDPIGMRLTFGSDTSTIVGVVGSVKKADPAAQENAGLYLPMSQAWFLPNFVTLAVRTADDPSRSVAVIKQTIASLDPTVPISDVKTMTARVSDSIGTTRFSTLLASIFAVVALALGAVGVYSVLAYIVSRRRREIAVRIALGASTTDVMRDVLRRAFILTALGLGLGSCGAWMLTRTLTALLAGVSPHDPRVFVGAAVLFALVTLAAAGVPALRTTRVSPVAALTSV